eukprot:g4592.t1
MIFEKVRVLPIPEQKSVNGVAFPLTLAPRGVGSSYKADLVQFLAENKEEVLEKARVHGAVLLRGWSSDGPKDFSAAAKALNLEPYEYIGGAAPRTVVVDDPVATVFTTNESPPEMPIPFHHEVAQSPNPPSYVMFYCEEPARVGGETPIISSELLAEYFFEKHTAFAEKVEKLGVKYVRVMPEADDDSSPIGRSWKSTFQVETREEAEAAMRKLGTTWEWLENGDVRTVTAAVPAIRTDSRSGRKTFFNSMVAAFKGWADSRNDASKAVILADGSPVDGAALEDMSEFMLDNRVAFKWKKHDVIIIDNRVTMHSRKTFERPRRILAALGGPSKDGFSVGSESAASLAGGVSPAGQISLTLSRTGDSMPAVGLGFWKISPDACAATVVSAVKSGYRHFDCATDYGNEEQVGQGIKQAIDMGLCERKDLFIVTKLWNTFHHPDDVETCCQKSLSDLGIDYIDLYLIHFPISQPFVPVEHRYPPEWVHEPKAKRPRMELASVPLHMTWPAMEALVDKGLVRNIGVANMGTAMLRDLLCYARIAPQVLQVELHPFNTQEKLVRFAKEVGIVVTGFSPLGAGSYVCLDMATESESALLHPAVVDVAKAHGKTPAQVLLRWALQRGISTIPKTTKEARLVENIGLFDFELDGEQMQKISALNKGRRFNDPGEFCQGMGQFCPIYD